MLTPKTLPMLFACLAFLVMRIGGAHLHHCFDGSEPENAVHFADAGVHHTTAAEASAGDSAHGDEGAAHHDDVDTRIAADPLSKLSLPEPSALIVVLLAVLLLPRARTPQPQPAASLRLPARPLHLRPPLRGPPAISFA